MSDTHFKAFLKFAENQPPDREIDHHGGWCHCAVGDFHEQILGPDIPLHFNNSPLLQELEETHPFIYSCLNNGDVPLSLDDQYDIITYSGLAKLMNDFAFDDSDYDER